MRTDRQWLFEMFAIVADRISVSPLPVESLTARDTKADSVCKAFSFILPKIIPANGNTIIQISISLRRVDESPCAAQSDDCQLSDRGNRFERLAVPKWRLTIRQQPPNILEKTKKQTCNARKVLEMGAAIAVLRARRKPQPNQRLGSMAHARLRINSRLAQSRLCSDG